MLALALFAYLLTLVDNDAAGKAYAAQGMSTSPWPSSGYWSSNIIALPAGTYLAPSSV